jgi:regulator of protease activity HflC (stomatin/prohibitin superfamily)
MNVDLSPVRIPGVSIRGYAGRPGMGTLSPNDTRYPPAAVVAGLAAAAGVVGIGALASLLDASAGALIVGVLAIFVGGFVGSSIKYADQRIRTTDFGAESCLTRDTVPVNVDAIAFWIVYDAERAALEVQAYEQAVVLAAQTALRDAIGKHDLAELIQSRKELGRGLQETLDAKMHDWGIQVQSVEIRDVIIPKALEEAMSRQAQAERERQARIILGTAETQIASKFVEAARSYSQNPVALNLRAMNMLYESIVKRGSLMVVPSGLADSLNVPNIMGLAGAAGAAAVFPTVAELTEPPQEEEPPEKE